MVTRTCRAVRAVVVGFLLITGPLPRPAHAEALSIDEANPPFMYAEDGKPSGIYPALMIEAFARLHEPLVITVLPWNRVVSTVDQGLAGGTGFYRSAEREKKYDYSEPIMEEEPTLYTLAGSDISFETLSDLHHRKIGILRGWSYGTDFDMAREAGILTTEDAVSDDINLEKLMARRIDAMVADKIPVDLMVAQMGLTGKVVALPTPLAHLTTHTVFKKGSGKIELLRRIDEALASMRRDGTFDRIVATELRRQLKLNTDGTIR